MAGKTIDLTPEMLKSEQGRALVQEAQQTLENSINRFAHVVALNLDDMEHGRGEDRREAFASVRRAHREWQDAGSDFAFTLGGINPKTRERYNFRTEK